PIVGAIGDINQVVVRHKHGVNGVVEPLGGRSLSELGARRELQTVIGFLSVRSPMTLVSAGGGIKDDDTVVEVSVGHKQLIGLPVHEQAGGPAQVLDIVAATVLARMADLQEEFSLVCELQDLVVLFRVSAQ